MGRKRYSDEQLSRILGEHNAGLLKPTGCFSSEFPYGEPACINQVAFNMPSCGRASEGPYQKSADWFDDSYQHKWSPDEFLAALEAEGFA